MSNSAPTEESASLPQELVTQARELAQRMEEFESRHSKWPEYLSLAQDLAHFLETSDEPVGRRRALSPRELQQFDKLLRDKRNAAGYSRLQLAQRAKLSDATIKFVETARHPASRATLIRLIAVHDLNLSWSDVPWEDSIAAGRAAPPIPVPESEPASDDLNCYITPAYEPVRMVMDLGRFLNGAGGHVEQTNAYLDHQSAAAYMAMCQQSAATVAMREGIPIAKVADLVVVETKPAGLEIVALGAGDAQLETKLAQYLAVRQAKPDLRLCLFDISQPLLSAGFKHAVEALECVDGVDVWALQGNFHHLPQYSQLRESPKGDPTRRRVFCMLGNTLANLDNEPRFFQHSLVACSAGDLLVLDVQQAHGATEEEILKKEPALNAPLPKVYAEWLAGPIRRHCRDVAGIDFAMELDLQCSLPCSYVLNAVATVRTSEAADRRFSMFRFKRYDIEKLTQCLGRLGWSRMAALPCGDTNRVPSMLMMFKKA